METIQVLVESDLLRAANEIVKRTGTNRSALVREALREYLERHPTEAFDTRRPQGPPRDQSAPSIDRATSGPDPASK